MATTPNTRTPPASLSGRSGDQRLRRFLRKKLTWCAHGFTGAGMFQLPRISPDALRMLLMLRSDAI